MSDKMSDKVPDKTSDKMSEKISEKMSGKMSDIIVWKNVRQTYPEITSQNNATSEWCYVGMVTMVGRSEWWPWSAGRNGATSEYEMFFFPNCFLTLFKNKYTLYSLVTETRQVPKHDTLF